jgi:hypothetical protein
MPAVETIRRRVSVRPINVAHRDELLQSLGCQIDRARLPVIDRTGRTSADGVWPAGKTRGLLDLRSPGQPAWARPPPFATKTDVARGEGRGCNGSTNLSNPLIRVRFRRSAVPGFRS